MSETYPPKKKKKLILSLLPSPPLGLRLAGASSPISITIETSSERVKPGPEKKGDEAPECNANFLPGRGPREREQSAPGEARGTQRLYYVHLRAQKRWTMRLRNGQLRPCEPPAFSSQKRGKGGGILNEKIKKK